VVLQQFASEASDFLGAGGGKDDVDHATALNYFWSREIRGMCRSVFAPAGRVTGVPLGRRMCLAFVVVLVSVESMVLPTPPTDALAICRRSNAADGEHAVAAQTRCRRQDKSGSISCPPSMRVMTNGRGRVVAFADRASQRTVRRNLELCKKRYIDEPTSKRGSMGDGDGQPRLKKYLAL